MPELLEAIPLLERFGGWIVLVVLLWVGGREFLSLARDFSKSVKGELRGLNDKLGTMIVTMERHESRLDNVDRSVDELRQVIQRQNQHPQPKEAS